MNECNHTLEIVVWLKNFWFALFWRELALGDVVLVLDTRVYAYHGVYLGEFGLTSSFNASGSEFSADHILLADFLRLKVGSCLLKSMA